MAQIGPRCWNCPVEVHQWGLQVLQMHTCQDRQASSLAEQQLRCHANLNAYACAVRLSRSSTQPKTPKTLLPLTCLRRHCRAVSSGCCCSALSCRRVQENSTAYMCPSCAVLSNGPWQLGCFLWNAFSSLLPLVLRLALKEATWVM